MMYDVYDHGDNGDHCENGVVNNDNSVMMLLTVIILSQPKSFKKDKFSWSKTYDSPPPPI